jgi:predicted dehydrogenase
LRVIIVGYGVQGKKRHLIAGEDCIGIVDPYSSEAQFTCVSEVPLSSYDAALVCTPDSAKLDVLDYLIKNGKHVLVEKPLMFSSEGDYLKLEMLARQQNVSVYTAYNHRFEPHFVSMKSTLESGVLGKVYSVRMFYGNGTARLVRNSPWRDSGLGVVADLGSHLLDTVCFWFGTSLAPVFDVVTLNRFENLAPDHCVLVSRGKQEIHIEMSLVSWRNHFYADIYGENGSVHIESLCKWGPTTFMTRERKLPSGRPEESKSTLVKADPTWQFEYDHFKNTCLFPATNLSNDIYIHKQMNSFREHLSAIDYKDATPWQEPVLDSPV